MVRCDSRFGGAGAAQVRRQAAYRRHVGGRRAGRAPEARRMRSLLHMSEALLEEQNVRLSRVVETAGEIATGDFGLDEVVRLVAERAKELTGSDTATVTLLDEGEPVVQVVTGETETTADLCVPLVRRAKEVGSLSLAKSGRRHRRRSPRGRAVRDPSRFGHQRRSRARGAARSSRSAQPFRDDFRGRPDRHRSPQPGRTPREHELGHA